MDGEELARLHGEIETAADALHAKAAEVHELARRLEELTQGTPAWYAGTRDQGGGESHNGAGGGARAGA
jgi:hypothetical protein